MKIYTTWLLLLITLSKYCSCLSSTPDADSVNLCARLKITRSYLGLSTIFTPAKGKTYYDCIELMIKLLKWTEFEAIQEVVAAFGEPSSIEEVVKAHKSFTSHSWNDPICIERISETLHELKKDIETDKNIYPYKKEGKLPLQNMLEVLENVTGFKTASWWKPLLQNRNVSLKYIIDKIVHDDVFSSTFEIYKTWMISNYEQRMCEELNLVEIATFSSNRTIKKLDAADLNKIFDIVCVDVKEKKKDKSLWKPKTLRFVFDQKNMKDAKLEYIEFVLQNCASIATEFTASSNTMDWTFQKVVENLQTLIQKVKTPSEMLPNEIFHLLVRAHITAIRIHLKMSYFDEIMDRAKNTQASLALIWRILNFFGNETIQVCDKRARFLYNLQFTLDAGNEGRDFVELVLVIYIVEQKYNTSGVLNPYISECIDQRLSMEFIVTFVAKATEKRIQLDAFKPFIKFSCSSSNISGENKIRKIYDILERFLNLGFMETVLLNTLAIRQETGEIHKQAYDTVLVYNNLGEKSVTGIVSFFKNFYVCACSQEMLTSAIRCAIRQGWHEDSSKFQELYGIICRGKNEDEIIHELNISNGTFKNLLIKVKEFIFTNKGILD